MREKPVAAEISTAFIGVVVSRALTRSILTRMISWLIVRASSFRNAFSKSRRERVVAATTSFTPSKALV